MWSGQRLGERGSKREEVKADLYVGQTKETVGETSIQGQEGREARAQARV